MYDLKTNKKINIYTYYVWYNIIIYYYDMYMNIVETNLRRIILLWNVLKTSFVLFVFLFFFYLEKIFQEKMVK